ncbi:MAG: GNAT family protein [Thermincola sp.]|jgi:RimJ/RimL family protein N-acetyltransferase|nr:GNAT family protein [Thermincola sp.]MDT3703876.1 GNAT family protein [Thermincola sp.]
MHLNGDKVIIRTMKRPDIPLLVKWKNDDEIADFVRGAPIHTTYDIENRRYEKGLREYDAVRLIIETLPGRPIGFISISDIDKDNQKADLGMLIGEKEYWSQGYGSDTLITLLRHLFFDLGFNRISLEVFEYNTRAKKVYEKIGFKVEGIERQGLLRKNQYYDIYLMGILQEDFENIFFLPGNCGRCRG